MKSWQGVLGGGGGEEYSLQWSDFGGCLASAFRELRTHNDFVDVTLACEGRSFLAHKAVLSICSPYLHRLLKSNPCKHPIVILQDVSAFEMEALLEYMYEGHVRVPRDRLPALLRCAEALQLRGLACDAHLVSAIRAEIPPPVCEEHVGEQRQECVSLERGGVASGSPRKRVEAMQLVPRTPTFKRRKGGAGAIVSSAHHFHHHHLSLQERLQGGGPSSGAEASGGSPRDGSSEGGDGGEEVNLSSSAASGPTDTVHALDLICAADEAVRAASDCLVQANHTDRALCLLDPDAAADIAHGGNGRRRNASDRPTSCPLCGSTIRQARNLRRHLELMHFNGGRPCLRVRGHSGKSGGKSKSSSAVVEVGVVGVVSVSSTGGGGSSPAVGGGSLQPSPTAPQVTDYAKEMQLNPYSAVMISNQMAAQAYFSHPPPPHSLATLPPPPQPQEGAAQDLTSGPSEQFLLHRQTHHFLHHHHLPPPPPSSAAPTMASSSREARGAVSAATPPTLSVT